MPSRRLVFGAGLLLVLGTCSGHVLQHPHGHESEDDVVQNTAAERSFAHNAALAFAKQANALNAEIFPSKGKKGKSTWQHQSGAALRASYIHSGMATFVHENTAHAYHDSLMQKQAALAADKHPMAAKKLPTTTAHKHAKVHLKHMAHKKAKSLQNPTEKSEAAAELQHLKALSDAAFPSEPKHAFKQESAETMAARRRAETAAVFPKSWAAQEAKAGVKNVDPEMVAKTIALRQRSKMQHDHIMDAVWGHNTRRFRELQNMQEHVETQTKVERDAASRAGITELNELARMTSNAFDDSKYSVKPHFARKAKDHRRRFRATFAKKV